ncbi:hypothetical protein KK062_17340 [Fulvivirgaceae bacterium PWU5]|uniref:Uncharacterized protein n=1 Tax=Dawidia cretensis TaxID=2782350 RepID=A0AAP2E1X4_9BACT|nr:hypothetical protein [Dawidia cretensis]
MSEWYTAQVYAVHPTAIPAGDVYPVTARPWASTIDEWVTAVCHLHSSTIATYSSSVDRYLWPILCLVP